MPQKNVYFNGLNGIRAICALAVIISHSSASIKLAGIETGETLMLATYGVTAILCI
jgi:peptidoglycan/LPS O-acetylase OafA/YrhL